MVDTWNTCYCFYSSEVPLEKSLVYTLLSVYSCILNDRVYVFAAVPSNPELVTANGSSDNLLAPKTSSNYRRHSSFQGLGKVSATMCQFHWSLLQQIRYDTICYFNVRCEAYMSRLNLPHGTNNEKWKTEKLDSKKRICSEVSVNSPGNPCSQSWRIKDRLRWEGSA